MEPKFHDHFSAVARRYSEFRPGYPEALFETLAGLVPHGALAWDCATGNGQAAVGLARCSLRVVATDASSDQIASASPHPNVEYRVARAEQSGLPDASVGLITVAQALHWFDLPRFYAEVRRVLAPDGVLAVWCYGHNEIEGEAVNELVLQYYSQTVGPYWPPERQMVEAGYRTLPFPFRELTPPAFRMEAQWTLEQLLGYLGTWSATSQCRRATGRDPLAPLATALSQAWGDVTASRMTTWPLSLRLGRVS